MPTAVEIFDPAKTSPYLRFTSGAAAARAQKSPLCPRPGPPNVNRSLAARVRTAEEMVRKHSEILDSTGQAIASLDCKQELAEFEAAILEEQMRREKAAEEAAMRARLTLPKKGTTLASSLTTLPLHKASSKAAVAKTPGVEKWTTTCSGMGPQWSPLVRHWAADTDPASPITTQEVGQRRRTTLFSKTALSTTDCSASSPSRTFSRSQSNLSLRKLDSSYWKGLTQTEIWDPEFRHPVSEPVSPIVLGTAGKRRRDLLFGDSDI